jgi:uncharacterized damage-inducible protein DinB
MALPEALLTEFDGEMRTTRRTLERLPEDRLEWRPHAKSMTMGRLAGHVAEIPRYAVFAVESEMMDLAARGRQPTVAKSRRDNLELFETNVAEARVAIAGASDDHLMKMWSLRSGEKKIFTMPRIAVLRALVLSHLIHHRAQLGVYYRLNDVPVPAVYGPSADEAVL